MFNENTKVSTTLSKVKAIKRDSEGYPIYPQNSKGLPVLPKDRKDQPYFPTDEFGFPVFPWDHKLKQWTFPVDDTEEPIFPRNATNKPLVPQDDKGLPIFPVDSNGTFIFPLDETNCPTPALTIAGKAVVPIDEYGNAVIPRDRHSKALIKFSSDGTPMSLSEYQQYKLLMKEQQKAYYQQQQVQQQLQQGQPPIINSLFHPQTAAMFHPLNLEKQHMLLHQDAEQLQRSKRVRPEDIDLPQFVDTNIPVNPQPVVDYTAYTDPSSSVNVPISGAIVEYSTNPEEKKAVDEKVLKRKKFLSALLQFSKKTGLPPPPNGTKKDDDDMDMSDEDEPKAKKPAIKK